MSDNLKMRKMGLYCRPDTEVLEGLEAVQKRPDVYRAIARRAHHLVYEVVDNPLMRRWRVTVRILWVTIDKIMVSLVPDDGRGIRTDMKPQMKNWC